MKDFYTREEVLDVLKAVNKENATGKQTRADIIQTMDVIGEMIEDRYLDKKDLEPVQLIAHAVEDYLDITGQLRRAEKGVPINDKDREN